MNVHEYLGLPWTVVTTVHDDGGEYYSCTIEELPGFLVAERTAEDLDREFWPALEAFLESYLAEGEEPPVPEAYVTDTVLTVVGSRKAPRFQRKRPTGTESAGAWQPA